MIAQSNPVNTLQNLAALAMASHNLEEALEYFEQLLAVWPNSETHLSAARLCVQLNRLETAIGHIVQAKTISPDLTEAHQAHGVVSLMLGREQDAEASFRRVISLQPSHASAHDGLGNALAASGRYDAAMTCFRQATVLQPDFVTAYCNWGDALLAINSHAEALSKYQQALALAPQLPRVWFQLGSLFMDQQRYFEALPWFEQFLEIQPELAVARVNLAICLHELGRYAEEREAYRRAIEADATCMAAHSGLLMALTDDPECTPEAYLQDACYFGQAAQSLARPCTAWSALQNWRPGQALRVGLVSGDLRLHPVGHFIEGVLANLDPTKIELFAYQITPHEDALTARLKPMFNTWRYIGMLEVDDASAANTIHNDGIHVLIDLGGHTRFNRLSTFAWKPAPLQVSWLGYFASTGVPGMDYLLADRVLVPNAHLRHFSEEIAYLPDTRVCYFPHQVAKNMAVADLPALENGYLTFGCFQNLRKLNNHVLALWGQVMQALPSARLLIMNKQLQTASTRQAFLQRIAAAGIAVNQVTIEGECDYRNYLEAYADVDMVLDTLPFTGCTTTCEALWMGVPTLTLCGDRLVGRQGVSLLRCVGLEDWIAIDAQDFVAKAIKHASDLGHLAALRTTLRHKIASSSLVDSASFARHLENILHELWLGRIQSAALDKPLPLSV